MTPERWQKVNEIFQSVVELETDDQIAYLKEACADDDSLIDQVETLLAANDQAGRFMVGNAAEDVAHLLTLENSPTLSGESLGHYEIISLLGTGGMGKVYLAKDPKLNRSIAVKTLPSSLSGKSDHIKRFQTEAKAAANLNHPNVATVYSVEETDDNQTFITMEYVEGKSLGDALPPDGLTQKAFLDLFIPIADALAHAHEKGIVHRDIKPNNIMITPDGNPKILDFGLAQIDKNKIAHGESTASLTKTGQVLGTPAYMSPEQAEGKEADHRTDIFSFGVVMYQAITGEKPFKGNNYASIISNLLKNDPVVVAEIKPEVPYLLSRLIMKCLNKEPRYRYQSMNEVRVILKEINSAFDSGASLSRPSQAILPKSKSVSPFFLYALLGVFGLLGAYGLWSWYSVNPDSDRPITRFILQHKKSDRLSTLNATISPDGKNLLFNAFQNDGERFFIRSLNSFDPKPIAGTENGNLAFFSPDGTWIAFSTKSESHRKVPIEGGNPITICENCPTSRPGHWGSDNNIYFSSKEGLLRVSADGGAPEKLTTVGEKENEHYQPQLLPDGKTVLFTVSRSDHTKLALLTLGNKKWSYIEETEKSRAGRYLSTGHIAFARENQLMAIPFDLSTLKTRDKPIRVLGDLFAMAPNIHISENGTLIYLQTISRTDNQVVWVDKNGNETPALEKRGDFSSPRISPDGSNIVVTYNDDIWVHNLQKESGVRITFEGRNEIPIWSRDGKSVIYSTEKDDSYTVYRKNANGLGEAEELHKHTSRISPYSLHPTDNTLAMTSLAKEGNSDILTKSLQDKTLKATVATKFREDTPRFSPDGKWLAYFSMDTGRPQIYVQSWGVDEQKIPVTKDGGMFPVWARSGRELFYRNGGTIYSVGVNNSTRPEFSNKKLLFRGKYLTSFDVSPNGERFLMVRDEHGTLPSKINIVLNWTEELQRIMRATK